MRIGIIAGEASGDMLGAHLIAALQARFKDLSFVGIAGPRMQALGARSLFPMEKLAVRGYVEVLKHFREIRGIQREVIAQFLSDPPDLFIGVDAPDFNLEVEERLKCAGITTIHHVSPSIWAWRGERIHKIKQAVSHVLTLFPFEAAIYERAHIPVSYVGHPLADEIPLDIDHQAAALRLGLDVERPIIALLPGSRQSELDYHGELFLRTAVAIHHDLPQAQFVAPFATEGTREQFESSLKKVGGRGLDIRCQHGDSQSALAAAAVTLIASGTATLEAALLKCPMVITYRVSAATAWLMRRKGRGYLPYIGLPNILAGEFIVPELLQEDATPENLSRAVINYLDDGTTSNKVRIRFREIHHDLRRNSSERIADALAPYIVSRQ